MADTKKRSSNQENEAVRLQKKMARLGIASRRESERMITAGRVTVNGEKVTELGTKVGPHDVIAVDGKASPTSAELVVVALYKPEGFISARQDPRDRKTIYSLLPDDLPFLAHVGRLDIPTEGIILMTNDGGFAQDLLSPANRIPRVYQAKVRGNIERTTIAKLEAGIMLDGRPTLPVVIEKIPSKSKHDWLELTLFEGRYRHVRRILKLVGHPVSRLRRVSFGSISTEGMELGAWRYLAPKEIDSLRSLLDV